MERRRPLQALAALGAALPPALEALQNIRSGVDRILGRDESSHVDKWEETVAEYGYAYLVTSPDQLLGDLATDMLMVQQILARAPSGDPMFTSWCRVVGGLGMLMAKTLSNLRQPRQARQWWVTAQQAADRSRDPDLSLWVSGEQLMHGLYENRPTPILLGKANGFVECATGVSCRGLAHVLSVRAQLHALGGRAEAAVADLRGCQAILEGLPSMVVNDAESIAGWGEDRLRYTDAFVYAHLGDRDRLDEAVDRAHRLLPDRSRMHVQLDLLQALEHVRAGGVTEGVTHALDVYGGYPAEQRTSFVAGLAEKMLTQVPVRNRAERAVLTYREMLTTDADQRREIT